MNNFTEFINKKFVYLVVGVGEDKSKWGYRVWKQMKLSGYQAEPVNPKYNQIDGEKCYVSISEWLQVTGGDLREVVVVTVVPPVVTKKIVDECVKLGINKIWMQPGSEFPENEGQETKGEIIRGMCIVRDGLEEAFKV